MSTLYVNTITPNSGDTVTVSGSLTTTGKLTIGDATSDTVVLTAEISSSIIPDADDTYSLGSNDKKWKDLYIDGTGYIDTIQCPSFVGGNFSGTSINSDNITASIISSSGTITAASFVGAHTLTTAVQPNVLSLPNVTSLGTLSSLKVAYNAVISGSNLRLEGSASVAGNVKAGHISSSGQISGSSIRTNTATFTSLPSSEAAAVNGGLYVLSGSQIFSSSAFPGGSNPVFSSAATSQSLFVFLKP